jgi:hypothetical protein
MTTELEHSLLAAKTRGDWDEYLRVLATARYLLLDAFRQHVDSDPGRPAPLPWRDPSGRNCLIVRTVGEAPAPRPDIATFGESPHWVLERWPPHAEWLLVNPDSPTEAYFSAGYRQRYLQVAAAVPEEKKSFPDVLVTDFDGPLHGPLAHGLACGGHLAVHNGVPWNGVGAVFKDYRSDARILREGWQTASRAQWVERLEALLDSRNPSPAEFVMQVRRKLAWGSQGRVDAKLWRKEVASALRAVNFPERQVKEAEDLVGRTVIYEESLRSDGLLPPQGFVGSVLAYNYGRAVTFARCGVSVGLAERGEAEAAILRVGELSRWLYRSWEEFSAAYVLGRVLSFGDEAFETSYAGAVKPHRVLAQDPGSPWRNLPFV